MTTSGIHIYTMTARDVVTAALREIKVLAAGTAPEASELRDGIQALNGMLLSWQPYSSLWRADVLNLVVTANASLIALPVSVRTVTAARIIAAPGGTERWLTLWEPDEYADVPVKGQKGTPVAIAEQRGRDVRTVTLWPMPDRSFDLILDVQLGTEIVTDASQTLDVPQDWLETVWTNLAVRLAGGYGSAAELTPELVSRAASLLVTLRDDDRPASYFAGPDYR